MAVPKAYTKFRNQLISELTRFPEYIGSRSCGVPMLSNCVVDFLISLIWFRTYEIFTVTDPTIFNILKRDQNVRCGSLFWF
jgi:hypothetical protein